MKPQRRCSECGVTITGRPDKVTCSVSCRVTRSKRLKRAATVKRVKA
jgi:predicted nucleic acid-binding Zn ribbon protein